MIRPVLLSALALFLLAPYPSDAHAQGRSIQARDGDLIVLPADATVTVVRGVSGHVRVASHQENHLLVVLVDEGPQPDGIVDSAYRFELSQPFPAQHVFDGVATVEEYEIIGHQRGGRAFGIVLPHGRILLSSGGPASRWGPFLEHVSALQYGRSSFSKVRETFDNAERQAVSGSTPGGIQAGVTLVPGAVSQPPSRSDGALRVGGPIRQPTKLRDVPPVLPALARQVGIQGVVIVEITIDTQGKVADARVLRSIPQLDQAALDAVRQWEYEPTYLNGRAVPVVMTVSVAFAM